jgi:hypothetical protein
LLKVDGPVGPGSNGMVSDRCHSYCMLAVWSGQKLAGQFICIVHPVVQIDDAGGHGHQGTFLSSNDDMNSG